MRQRDTFTVTEPGANLDSHLWIVVSDPSLYPDQVFSVNVTSSTETWDGACVLYPDDHPWLCKESCINYNDAQVFYDAELEKLLDKGLLTTHEPVSEVLFVRIVDGIGEARVEIGYHNLLVSQNLIAA